MGVGIQELVISGSANTDSGSKSDPFFLGICLFTSFVDNQKNIEYFQPYPLITLFQ